MSSAVENGVGPVFVASFPTAPAGPLHGSAFLYDNAVAAIALSGCGDIAKARRIGDAIRYALDHDRFWHDGRLRNAYAAGTPGPGDVKLPGWWDADRNQWLEDRYQVASDTGNMAWAMLALMAVDKAVPGAGYRDAAATIGRWIAGRKDARGAGGFTGGTFGHEPAPTAISWKSTEHNTDLAAAFGLLANATGGPEWRELAAAATTFVQAMWADERGAFVTGTGDDGVTINPMLALDAQVWPLLALPDAIRRYDVIGRTIEASLAVGDGVAYGPVRDGVWTEGTAQAALLDRLAGQQDKARRRLSALAPQRLADGSYLATSTASLPTGFVLATDPSKPRLYFRLPHLAATAWVALAECGFNPFTATGALPAPHS
ncbi:MAG: hypothetical protein F8N37_18870 [Telmatospirillum sp.]|nr:hypothetical protein [Telmatospirillum sp.]